MDDTIGVSKVYRAVWGWVFVVRRGYLLSPSISSRKKLKHTTRGLLARTRAPSGNICVYIPPFPVVRLHGDLLRAGHPLSADPGKSADAGKAVDFANDGLGRRIFGWGRGVDCRLVLAL